VGKAWCVRRANWYWNHIIGRWNNDGGRTDIDVT